MAVRQIVIAGLGSIGRRHARLLAARGDLELLAVEPDAGTLAAAARETKFAATSASLEEMLALQPELALVATPHHLHARQAILCLEAGCHVLCEKPMSDSLGDARRMQRAAEKNRRVLSVGFNLHFHPCLLRLREHIKSGQFGRMLHLEARVGTYGTLVNSASRYQANLPGALFWDYVHQPDVFYWLTGEAPRQVYALGRQVGDMELSASPNLVMVNFEYASGLLAHIHLNYIQDPLRHCYEVVGTDGWGYLEIGAGEGILTVGQRAGSRQQTERIEFVRDAMYTREHDDFLATVGGSQPPESSGADGLVSMAVCTAAIKSWRQQRRIKVALTTKMKPPPDRRTRTCPKPSPTRAIFR